MSADAVRLSAADGGAATLVSIRAQPGARRRGVAGVLDGSLKLAVTGRAVNGQANKQLLKLAAEIFGLRASAVSLVRGHSARTKTLRLEAPPTLVRDRLSKLLEEMP